MPMLRFGLVLLAVGAFIPSSLSFHVSQLPLSSLSLAKSQFVKAPCRSLRAAGKSVLSLKAKDEGLQDVGAVAGGFSNKGEPPIQLRGFSLANLALFGGLAITIVSFYNYFTNGGSVTSLGFIYGLPITLGGFALKYAEILPVDVESNEAGDRIYEEKATEVLRCSSGILITNRASSTVWPLLSSTATLTRSDA
jgi:hypothetical protein